MLYENYDIAIAMSSSRADPVLEKIFHPTELAGGNLIFNSVNWPGWRHLNQCYCTEIIKVTEGQR